MDSVVEEIADSSKKHRNYFKLIVSGISIAVTIVTPVIIEFNSHSSKRAYDEGRADFKSRPTIQAVHGGFAKNGAQNIVPVKVVNFGEDEKDYGFLSFADGRVDLRKFYQVQNETAFGDTYQKIKENAWLGNFHYPVSLIVGRSVELKKELLPFEFSVCVVQSKQTGEVSSDGTYYLFNDDMPIYAKKDLVDFAIKSHEAGHCYFRTYTGERDESDPDVDYKNALMEVSGDLASILDYARVTGTMDMFTDFWRPYRLVNASDRVHQTAWALDVVLQDKSIDLDAIKRKGPEEIGPMVTYLMEKHFADRNGEYTIQKSAASLALAENLKAQKWFDEDSPEDAVLKTRLKSDIAQSMVDHRAKWASIAPGDAVELFDKRISRWSEKYGIDIQNRKPTSVVPHKDILTGKRPMGVLEYLTGKEYPL